MDEVFFYNALAAALENDYRKLEKFKSAHGTWRAAWESLADKKGVDPETEWRRLSGLGIKLVLKDNDLYPRRLGEISQPPFGIYVLGTLPETELSLAIVGTRKATSDGKNIARQFAGVLTEKRILIVSGLALGIDAAAHEGCLDAGGKTIAVLGSGVDNFYPRTNERLAKNILKSGGSVISEYSPGSPPLPHRFLERNRIVSGLSRGTLVIEAPKESGALVTARHALDQNRDVFVIPGPISHPNYMGSNQLIRRGAELITGPEEILEAWEISGEAKTPAAGKFDSEAERIIFEILSRETKPLGANEIAATAKLGISETNGALTMMILKNTIGEEGGGGYIIK